ncbi:MAG TPA: thiolase family protein [Syntrophothermus lipocalidus]|uniref:acetyl-CoA C-acetyltransferase n=1 Tax=Syntrophothermus lipocalidus (strain DSM 12680 / TGB-C1) TaxID=643648 RepID=D7CKP8_SYNLT|nr:MULTISPECIES: thiolase family protein [Syntrophothermus]ADI01283.1 acetyl-CoA acetyltransferase [Syntrophothermus lipocalidus DSM 12680]NSW82833.1 thiolase family protein [Syntrophothermus sp.]HHV76356.1 thiolase family protein [Syntrophothermus lipocalidus]HOV42490.1 thiolase family protein [Syntrophothermus lipocalidus]
MINEVVMVSACRTAIGDFMGSLKDLKANDLSAITATEALKRAGIQPEMVDSLVLGMCLHHGNDSGPARQVAMAIGMRHSSWACMVNQNCASAMRALEIAANELMLGKSEISLVVGTESMTNVPYILRKARFGYRLFDGDKAEDAMICDGLFDKMVPGHMAITAENVAEKYGITREECDELALLSHTRALKANAEGIFAREIVPVEIKTKKGVKVVDKDEHPMDTSLEKLAQLPPVFKKGGVVTAGNASGINDGSAAAVLMTKKKAEELGIKPLMKLLYVCSEGVDPKFMGLGPAVAIPKVLNKAGLKFEDVEYWEINEAFAAQWLGVGRMLKEDFGIELDLDKVNHNGSGIGLGHPVGCTGLRIQVSMYYEMERLGLTIGGASLCVGGGPAMAALWTRDI